MVQTEIPPEEAVPLTRELLEKRVAEFLQRFDESLYKECVEELCEKRVGELRREDIVEVIGEKYLKKWGRMYRVLGKKKGWEEKLTKAIEKHAGFLDEARGMDLARVSDDKLNTLQRAIFDCYKDFADAVGQTCAGKALHILAPNFFPQWDSKVRRAHGIDRTPYSYLTLVHIIRERWLRKDILVKTLEELEQKDEMRKFRVGKLRLIDMYTWRLVKESEKRTKNKKILIN